MEIGTTRFTSLQGQYLAFIWAYTKIHGRSPAESDMQRYLEVTRPSVHQMVPNLEKRGLISRVAGQPRSIRVLVSGSELPVLEWLGSRLVRACSLSTRLRVNSLALPLRVFARR